MNELITIQNNQAVVSSRQVAENFGKLHKDVLENIRQILAAENSATKFYQETAFENRGKQYPAYLMNRDGFSLLVMGFTGQEALKWKIKYISAFNKMENELNRQAAKREASRITRRDLTDIIRDEIPDSPHKRYMYKNYTDLVYKTVLGCTAKQFRELHGLEKDANVRGYLTANELDAVERLECLVKDCIRYGLNYEQVKDFLNKPTAKIKKSPHTLPA